MLDPSSPQDIRNFKRTDEELFEFWLFCLFVRGKNADVQAVKLDQFLKELGGRDQFFHNHHRYMSEQIDGALRKAKVGQYDSLTLAITQTLENIDKFGNGWLRHASVTELEQIQGVGPKTSRFFVINIRPNQRHAALDTHILTFLGDHYGIEVPKNTPTGSRYSVIEQKFLDVADEEGIEPEVLDLAVWRATRETSPRDWRKYVDA